MNPNDKWYCLSMSLGKPLSAPYWTHKMEDWDKEVAGYLPSVVDKLNVELCLKGSSCLRPTHFPNHPWHQSIGTKPEFDAIKLDDKYITTTPEPMYVVAKVAPAGGVTCCKCNGRNPDAGPNMKDGRYTCYQCR